ncbi:uncharacterized protein LOC132179787 [Corylus avellana]|uniref:uncharacterized protein LOC132179787 n=1 Tax=Corylus avellana TaxID=13451 RepID=UPI001E1FBD80|nr:uncharacterized protein LOC132179787 [Corylus avellana]
MSRTGSWVSYKLPSILQLLLHQRSFSGRCASGFAADYKLGNGGYNRMNRRVIQFFSTNYSKTQTKLDANKVNHGNGKFQSPAPAPPKLFFPRWAKWVWGSILAISLPLWNQDWGKLRRIEGEADMVVEEVEGVAKVVEKVATVAEKISAEVADKLPEKGKLKEAALFVEHVAEEAAHDAQLTENFIQKVDALKEDLEALVEPIIGQIAKKQSGEK